MAEAKAQRVRRVLVNVVSSYDALVVRKAAIDNSAEFVVFLDKKMDEGSLDSLDHVDITMEIEEQLGIQIPDDQFPNWRAYFDKIVFLLSEQ